MTGSGNLPPGRALRPEVRLNKEQEEAVMQTEPTYPTNMSDYPDPTAADLADPLFEAVWQAIKDWDLSREPWPNRLYSGATGNDVMHILRAVRSAGGRDG